MKRLKSILVIAALALAAAACSKTATNSNNANTSTNTSNTKTTNTTTTTNSSTSTSTSADGSSPTAAFKALYNSFKTKDVAALKKTMASADLKDMEERGKKTGTTVDESLKTLMDFLDETRPTALETRNETINGDKATLEVKDQDGTWDTVHFIKEGGEWKVRMSGDDDAKKSDAQGGNDKN